MIGAGVSFLSHARNALDFSLNFDILFFVMSNFFDEMMADMYQVKCATGTAGFPRSHDGLEKAIKLADEEDLCVTFKGEVVWSPECGKRRLD